MNKTPVLGAIVMITLGITTLAAAEISSQEVAGALIAWIQRKAPIATSGDNTYIAWWTNKTGNDEVMFRSSTDNGATFGDKINLSNSTNSESQDAEIAAQGDNVIISWWERNVTSNEPVVRMSTDNGQTFGPILKLASNGTIGEGPD